ncbi:MAG: macro domain-containing protein [Candidatus Hydrogenedens sp.]
MISYISNCNVFESCADALVNPENCKGVMGKGIALEFKKRFPEIMQIYKEVYNNKKLAPGILLFFRVEFQLDLCEVKKPALILFLTKNRWRDKSKMEWIEKGLIFLKEHYKEWELNSVTMPQIGCGLGGLSGRQVKVVSKNILQSNLYR